MVKKLIIITIALSLLLITACAKDPTNINTKYKYSVYAYLKAGEILTADNPVYIKKVISPQSPDMNPTVENAVAYIAYKTPEGLSLQISLKHIGDGKYIFESGDIEFVNYMAETGFLPNVTYNLVVDIQGEIITAKTTIPDIHPNDIFSDSLSTTPMIKTPVSIANNETNINNAIRINCPPDSTKQIYVETYCLEPWTNAWYVDVYGGIEKPEKETEYEDPVTHQPRKIAFTQKYLPIPGMNQIVISNYSYLFVFYGDYRLTCYVIDDNYYTYSYKPQGWEHGGIVGGYGVFGSIAGKQFYVHVND